MKLRLWFAPGALFQESDAELAYGAEPPPSITAMLSPRPPSAYATGLVSPKPLVIERMIFQLEALTMGPDGKVAHYELVSQPPAGKRWILLGPGRVCSETIADS